MGMADFYLSINANDILLDKINNKLVKYLEYNVFNYIYQNHEILVECFFDNLIITTKLLYNACSMEKKDMNQIKIETGKENIIHFNFNSELELLNWLYRIYNNKLQDYFENLGFIRVPAQNYYNNRKKLK